MKLITICLGSAVVIAVTICMQPASAQDLTMSTPKEPKINLNVKATSNPSINNFVSQCFNMYNNVNNLSQKIQSIQHYIINGSADGGLTKSIADLNDAMSGFQGIKSNGPALVSSIAGIIANIKDQHLGILEIPRALLNLREASKAIKYSIESSVHMLGIIPDLKRKITITDTVAAKSTHLAMQPPTEAIAQTANTTITLITLKGISFSTLQQLGDTLAICPLMKNIQKSMAAGIVTLEIAHTGTMNELWKFIVLRCKSIGNEKNITAWDEQNNRIDIAMN